MSYLDLLKFGLPEAILTITVLAVLGVGLGRRNQHGAGAGFVAVLGLFATAGALTLLLPAQGTLGQGMLVLSPLNILFKLICVLLALFTVMLAGTARNLSYRAEYHALILLGTIGLMLLVGSEEFLMIFIGLELTGLSLYLLTGWDRNDGRSAEAALKYFLFGSTASAFTLFGLSFVYGVTGTTGLAAIAQKIGSTPASPLLFVGIVMTLVGFAFKIAAAPFHLWAPDTYQGAPVSSAAFIASGSKVASFVVLGKIVLIAFAPLAGSAAWHGLAGGWSPILAVLAALSIVIGNLAALAQTNVRRLLAYSAVAHAGYTLLGLISGRTGFAATLFYITTYAITLLGAFGVVGFVRETTGNDDLASFAGLHTRSPLLAGCMAIFLLSLAGLPPLAGFFGKFYLFSTAMHSTGLTWLVALALFGSLISIYYYLVILKVIFVDETPAASPAIHLDLLGKVTVGLLTLLLLLLGFAPEALVARIIASL